MQYKQLEQLISQLENYLECWKQFNAFINLARAKKFSQEDENQFLEIKSVIVQELELILATIESGAPSKQEIHAVIDSAPSLRFLSEMNEGGLRSLETQWHKIFISWQSILGQLKVKRNQLEPKSMLGSVFGKRK
jgi:hypothetical protein